MDTEHRIAKPRFLFASASGKGAEVIQPRAAHLLDDKSTGRFFHRSLTAQSSIPRGMNGFDRNNKELAEWVSRSQVFDLSEVQRG